VDAHNNSTAVVVFEDVDGDVFDKPTPFDRQVVVTGLEAAETVVLRTDVAVVCNGDRPRGNMQARLADAEVTAPESDTISSGDQAIPFKHVGRICDPKTEQCEPPK